MSVSRSKLRDPSRQIDDAPRRSRSRSRMIFWRSLVHNWKVIVGVILVGAFVVIAVFAPLLAPYSPSATSFMPLQSPSFHHLLGTTDSGQDVFSQFVWATRASLIIGVVAGGLATFFSMLVGMMSGYAGGLIDEVLQLITNVFLIIPALPLMVVLAAYITLGGSMPIIIVIAATGWAWGARVLRSQTLSMRSAQYVDAAKIAGESRLNIVFRTIMPNMIPLIFSGFLFTFIYAILAAAGLEFLGLGNLSGQNWGTMLYWAENGDAMVVGAWWWFVPPGLAIALVGTGLAFINYAIDEFSNPRIRKVRMPTIKKKAGLDVLEKVAYEVSGVSRSNYEPDQKEIVEKISRKELPCSGLRD